MDGDNGVVRRSGWAIKSSGLSRRQTSIVVPIRLEEDGHIGWAGQRLSKAFMAYKSHRNSA